MNVFLWILQVVLALLSFAGGAYKAFMFDRIATVPAMSALTRGGATAVGLLEMLCAVLLVVPAASKWRPAVAAVLALESLGLALLYARYSLALTATNPLPYVIVIGVLAAVVAYGRYALRPPA
jgi:hypothetical protein